MNVAEPMKARVMDIMNKIFKWVIKYIHYPHFYFLVTINIHTTSNYSHIYTQVIREAAPNCFKGFMAFWKRQSCQSRYFSPTAWTLRSNGVILWSLHRGAFKAKDSGWQRSQWCLRQVDWEGLLYEEQSWLCLRSVNIYYLPSMMANHYISLLNAYIDQTVFNSQSLLKLHGS